MKQKILILLVCITMASPPVALARETGLEGVLVTTSGSTQKNVRSITFIFSSDFTGTVAGVAFNGANDSSFSPPVQTGDTFDSIAYTVTTGNIRIMFTR